MPEVNQVKNRKVSWIVFVWVIGIITLALGWVFVGMNSLNGKVEASNNDMVEIKVLLSEVRTDVSWIKDKLNK